jgi:3-methylcrotonyl-CoA carboxylase alpha subunit
MKSLRAKNKLWVQWQGRLYGMPLSLDSKRGKSADEAQELEAPFSCKVLKIHVQDGQTVKKGDPVVVVEAMKMEYAYASPRDGVIAKVQVKEGAVVPAGTQFVQWRQK